MSYKQHQRSKTHNEKVDISIARVIQQALFMDIWKIAVLENNGALMERS